LQTKSQDIAYTGPLEDHDTLVQWITAKCMPLVREITFENAEVSTKDDLLALYTENGLCHP